MAMMDSFLEISDAQAVTLAAGAAGSVTGTNVIDLGAAGTDTWGSGDTIYPSRWNKGELMINVQTVGTVSGAGSATNCNLIVRLLGSNTSAAACTPGGTSAVIVQSNSITSATYKVGGTKLWQIAMPRHNYRWMTLSYYVSDDPIDIAVNAWVGLDTEFGHMD